MTSGGTFARSVGAVAVPPSEPGGTVARARSTSPRVRYDGGMAKRHWDPSLDTAMANVDQQHERILELLDVLPEELGPAQRKYAFNELLKHVNENFVEEERAMLLVGFPGYAAHKKTHDALLRELLDAQEQLAAADDADARARDILRVWMIEHLRTFDAQFAEFVRTLRERE